MEKPRMNAPNVQNAVSNIKNPVMKFVKSEKKNDNDKGSPA